MTNELLESYMDLVYEEVELAIHEGNPPFAAVIVDAEGVVIAKAHNQANTKKIAISHAEVEAINLACLILKQKKLKGCTLYANAESCAMCSGAIIKAGISKVVYGAPFEKGSSPDIYLREINARATPALEIVGGIMSERFMEQITRGRQLTGKAAVF